MLAGAGIRRGDAWRRRLAVFPRRGATGAKPVARRFQEFPKSLAASNPSMK
jgi:hypothetical protein